MVVPALDRCIGMEVYSTDIQGIDGSIKQTKDQFIVEEILDNLSLDLTNNADEEHQYPLYLLKKLGNHPYRVYSSQFFFFLRVMLNPRIFHRR